MQNTLIYWQMWVCTVTCPSKHVTHHSSGERVGEIADLLQIHFKSTTCAPPPPPPSTLSTSNSKKMWAAFPVNHDCLPFSVVNSHCSNSDSFYFEKFNYAFSRSELTHTHTTEFNPLLKLSLYFFDKKFQVWTYTKLSHIPINRPFDSNFCADF